LQKGQNHQWLGSGAIDSRKTAGINYALPLLPTYRQYLDGFVLGFGEVENKL